MIKRNTLALNPLQQQRTNYWPPFVLDVILLQNYYTAQIFAPNNFGNAVCGGGCLLCVHNNICICSASVRVTVK